MTKPIYQLYEEYRIIQQVCLICGHSTLDKNIENHIMIKHAGEVDI